ncbi:MAG TPA: tRNA-intron lyase [Nitrososphaeraceae archaeon]|nr:tRNA-intron lyase [Nitrososphaeraceae archaeon]
MSADIEGSDLDISYLIEAIIPAGETKILVTETKFQDQLRSKGFGESEDSQYTLSYCEALYLAFTNRLVIKNKEDIYIGFEQLVKKMLKHDPSVLTRFLVYRDLRSRGYVVKDGFGFGIDFRVYERGEYQKKPSKYLVYALNEGINLKIEDLYDLIDQTAKMGKNSVLAVIERRGEVIYYKASKYLLKDNKFRQESEIDTVPYKRLE